MTERGAISLCSVKPARQVFDARLKVGGRRLPAAVVVPLAFVRNLVLGWFGGGDWVAPAYVLVTRRASGLPVARIPAGSDYNEQLDVLEAVQQTLDDLDEDGFLARWEVSRSP